MYVKISVLFLCRYPHGNIRVLSVLLLFKMELKRLLLLNGDVSKPSAFLTLKNWGCSLMTFNAFFELHSDLEVCWQQVEMSWLTIYSSAFRFPWTRWLACPRGNKIRSWWSSWQYMGYTYRPWQCSPLAFVVYRKELLFGSVWSSASCCPPCTSRQVGTVVVGFVFVFFHMWGGGTVLPLDIYSTAHGHLNELRRRSDLRCHRRRHASSYSIVFTLKTSQKHSISMSF